MKVITSIQNNSLGEPQVFIYNYEELVEKAIVKPHTEVIGEGYVAFSSFDGGHYYIASPDLNGDQTFDIDYKIVNLIAEIQIELIRNGVTSTPNYSAIDGITITVNELEPDDIVKIYVKQYFEDNYAETQFKGLEKPFIEQIPEYLVTVTSADGEGTTHTFIKNYNETYFKGTLKDHQEVVPENLVVQSTNDPDFVIRRNYSETYPKFINKPIPAEYITERLAPYSGADSAGITHQFARNYDETITKPLDKRGYNTNPDHPEGLGFGRFDLAIPENLSTSTALDNEGTSHSVITNYSETQVKGIVKVHAKPEESISERLAPYSGADSLGTIHQFAKNYDETIARLFDKRGYNTNPGHPEGLGFGRFDLAIPENLSNTIGLDSAGTSHTLLRNYLETILKSYSKQLTESITERLDTTGQGLDSLGANHLFPRNYDETVVKPYLKNHTESIPENLSTNTILDSEGTSHALINNYSETEVKSTVKDHQESIPENLVVQSTNDPDFVIRHNYSETYLKATAKSLTEILELLELVSKSYFKNVPDELLTLSDNIVNLVQKNIVFKEFGSTENEAITASFNRVTDYVNNTSKAHTESIPENLSSTIGLDSAGTSHTILRNYNETILKDYRKDLLEALNLIEIYAVTLTKIIPDEVLFATDIYINTPILNKEDSAIVDPFEDLLIQNVPGTGTGTLRVHEVMQLITDTIFVTKAIFLDDSFFPSDSSFTFPTKNLTEILNAPTDALNSSFIMGTLAEPALLATDTEFANPNLNKTESTVQSDTLLGHGIYKGPVETINTSMYGRMILSTYDDQSSYPFNTYFVYDSDYRNSTTLT